MNRHPHIPPHLDDLPPRAPATGPFPRRPFLTAVTALTGESPFTISDESAAIVAVEESGEIRFAGEADLTDYHCPLGSEVKSVVSSLVEQAELGTRFRFDSVPGEVAGELVDAFATTGVDAVATQHDVAAVVDLTGGYEAYLHSIGKKQRHELRRKRRRYVEAVGELIHEVHTGDGWALGEFFRLHRRSEGDKGRFMTAAREDFFRMLVAQDGWRVDLLRVPGEDRAAACLFTYVDEEGAYLYNGCYDPVLADASPGVAIVGSMIERVCEEGLPRFDFLKGDESYKFRLGAAPRPLFEIVGVK